MKPSAWMKVQPAFIGAQSKTMFDPDFDIDDGGLPQEKPRLPRGEAWERSRDCYSAASEAWANSGPMHCTKALNANSLALPCTNDTLPHGQAICFA